MPAGFKITTLAALRAAKLNNIYLPKGEGVSPRTEVSQSTHTPFTNEGKLVVHENRRGYPYIAPQKAI